MSIPPDVAAADHFRGYIRLRPGLRHLARDGRSGGRLRKGGADFDLAGPARFFFFGHALQDLRSDPSLLSEHLRVREGESWQREKGNSCNSLNHSNLRFHMRPQATNYDLYTRDVRQPP